jgi:hypothetical protein
MSYEIEYTDKWSGTKQVHVNKNSESDARGWTQSLAEKHGCKAVCTRVADGPYDHSGTRTHITSEGDDRK